MKNYLALFIIICTSYLVSAFILWEINAANWHYLHRWGLVISVVVTYVLWRKANE